MRKSKDQKAKELGEFLLNTYPQYRNKLYRKYKFNPNINQNIEELDSIANLKIAEVISLSKTNPQKFNTPNAALFYLLRSIHSYFLKQNEDQQAQKRRPALRKVKEYKESYEVINGITVASDTPAFDLFDSKSKTKTLEILKDFEDNQLSFLIKEDERIHLQIGIKNYKSPLMDIYQSLIYKEEVQKKAMKNKKITDHNFKKLKANLLKELSTYVTQRYSLSDLDEVA